MKIYICLECDRMQWVGELSTILTKLLPLIWVALLKLKASGFLGEAGGWIPHYE